MEFKDFVQILHPIIGGSSSQAAFTKTLFDVLVTEDGQSAVDEPTETTYRSYFNGQTGISRIAKKSAHTSKQRILCHIFMNFQMRRFQVSVTAFGNTYPQLTALTQEDSWPICSSLS